MAIVSDRYMKGFDRALRKLARLVKKATVRHTRPGPSSGYVLEGKLNLEHEGRPATTKQETSSMLMQAKFMWAEYYDCAPEIFDDALSLRKTTVKSCAVRPPKGAQADVNPSQLLELFWTSLVQVRDDVRC
jgi:hypothetical protein